MSKSLLMSFLGLALVATVSCSKKVKEDSSAEAAGPGGLVKETDAGDVFKSGGSDAGIAGLSTVNFAYDSATLDSTARNLLKQNADWIKGKQAISLQIEGHCDSRGSVEYNLALGERRAKAVKDYLTSLGVQEQKLSIISYGKEKPLELGDSEAVHARNRRANFVPLAN